MMVQKIEPATTFYPYPVAAGSQYGFRMFDGEKWVDCDEIGERKSDDG